MSTVSSSLSTEGEGYIPVGLASRLLHPNSQHPERSVLIRGTALVRLTSDTKACLLFTGFIYYFL
jgi:hypothetical protein